MEEHVVDVKDVNGSGFLIYSRYSGMQTIVKAVITKIDLVKLFKTPSIYSGVDIVYFRLLPGEQIPAYPDTHLVTLHFDSDVTEKQFRIGDVWEIALTDNAKLVNLWPAGQPALHP